MRRDTQAVLLLLVGATLLKISFAGTYVRYVKPGLVVLLVLAGIALIAIAGVTLWQVMRPGQHADDNRTAGQASRDDGAHDGRSPVPVAGGGAAGGDSAGGESALTTTSHERAPGHGPGEARVGWLLLLPALALLLVAPPALGSFQASRNGTALSTRSESDFAPLAAGDPVQLTLLDYAARAVFDRGSSLMGRRVSLSGFVIVGPRGAPYLSRLVVGCCAADARPVKVGLTGDVPSDLVADQWIQVEGTYTEQSDRDPVNRDIIPYLQVVEFRTIEAPEQPYES